MKKHNQPTIIWDEENRSCTYIITDGVREYIGESHCHPDDYDMCSEKVGTLIAERRAIIKMWRGYREEIKAKLAALSQLYYSMSKSKKFNARSYEAKMLKRQMAILNNDLEEIKNHISLLQRDLKEWLKNKNKFYAIIRMKRDSKKDNNN